MSPRTVERVDDWDTVPFGGGYGGLRDLASQEFSGVVTAGPTRLFMIRGTVVGVLDGSIDDFEDSGGNAREAPHPALPLLAVMQERSDEVRAKYYTEDTPISDVDRTLADGSFTGYVELSENVLSGDYYQVYHQGRSMSVAYVGSSERLITDDEAFDQANDEVGIYEVRPVDIEAIDIPEPSEDTGETADASEPADAGGAAESTGAAGASTTAAAGSAGDSPADETGQSPSAEEPPASDPDTVDIPSATSDADAAETRRSEQASADSDTDRSGAQEPTAATESDEPATKPDSGTEETPSTQGDDRQSASSTDDAVESGRATDRSTADEGLDDTHPGAKASSSTDESSSPAENSSSASQSPTDRQPATDRQSSNSQGSTATRQSQQNAAEPEPSRRAPDSDQHQAGQAPSGESQATDSGSGPQGSGERSSGPSSSGAATDLEVRSIPSLDPSRTEAASRVKAKRKSAGSNAAAAQQSQSQQGQQRSSPTQEPSSTQRSERPSQESGGRSNQGTAQRQAGQSDQTPAEQQTGSQDATQQSSPTGAEAKRLASELESREQEIEDLRTDIERVEAERDDLATERDDLEAERDRLQAELDEAQAEIERLTERLEDFAEDGAGGAGTQLSAGEAIDNTNLFVRYRSKGDATLETAHSGNADRSSVAENMRLEYHTQFDANDAAVGNESFDDFLTGTIQYRFVDWIIGSLLYEIRDTGHADGMADLYNALPKIDRAELNGQVSVNYTEDGEEHRSQERFDIVVRDRMGNPLIVANINDSRDPATDAMMTDLVKRAERVGESGETLAGAFLVTESFFEPGALETAEGATSSGLFSRDKRKSFVNLSRKGGYHLCLVEARNEEFHLAVPEL